MPRTGRGGPREGTPGQTYANRTDLPGKVLPIQTVPGQEYGQQTAQQNAMRQVPMSGVQVPTTAAPVQGGAQQPPPGPQPGSLGAFNRPTERPNEPITAGLPTGPGPGPEATHPFGAAGAGQMRTADMLKTLSTMPGANQATTALSNFAAAGNG